MFGISGELRGYFVKDKSLTTNKGNLPEFRNPENEKQL